MDPTKYDSTQQNATTSPSEVSKVETIKDDPLQIETLTLDLGHRFKAPALAAGMIFGSYLLVRLLGRGGFGQVWEAEDVNNRRLVALKVLAKPDQKSAEVLRFRQEGRLSASLNHPHCVYVFEAKEVDGYPVIAMELMPGGTLQDRLDKGEKFSTKEAVDRVLEMIDGLEAAHKAGIIHRDVKPSNCFVDTHGKVKIGDFGISKSLESDAKYTLSGCFIGTPGYASPEQIRGRTLDFRSDLYSMGACFYALLTGSCPFVGSQPGEILARILTEDPVPFSKQYVHIPQELQKIIFQMMAKDPNKRFASYSQLRTALLPFSSYGLQPGQLGRRFGAWMIDLFFLSIAGIFLTFLLLEAPAWINHSSLLALDFIYFFFFERFLGRTPGKLMLGLRVLSSEGMPLGTSNTFLRTTIFVLVTNAAAYLPFEGFTRLILELFFASILLISMRKRNGYAGLHELISQTRVMTSPQKRRIEVPEAQHPSGSFFPVQQFGPYKQLGVIWQTENEALVVAEDEELERKVWIHFCSNQTQLPPIAAMSRSGEGRLQWLQGVRGEENWDAFEAPSGTSLSDWLNQKNISWLELRQILKDLSSVLVLRLQHYRFTQYSLAHIWVDTLGRTKLLDFPAVELQSDPSHCLIPLENWNVLIHQLIIYALDGVALKPEQLQGRMVTVPFPEYARSLIEKICKHEYESPQNILDALKSVEDRPAIISRGRRIASFFIPIIPVAVIVFISLLVFFILSRQPEWGIIMMARNYIDYVQKQGSSINDERRTAIQQIFSYSYVKYLNAQGKLTTVIKLTPDQKKIFAEAFRHYPNVTQSEFRKAFKKARMPTAFQLMWADPRTWLFPVSGLILLISALSIPAIVFSIITRGGIMLRLLGIGIQNKNGQRASRLRCFIRASIGWSFWLILLLTPPNTMLLTIVLAVIALGVSYAIFRPERGIPEVITKTSLVPS